MCRPGQGATGGDTEVMLIRIEASDLPGATCGPGPDAPDGRNGVYVGVQRRGRRDELLDPAPGDAAAAAWTLQATVTDGPDGPDVTGLYVQGPRGGRFIYLSWFGANGDRPPEMFRRAKLWLTAVPGDVLADAARRGVLVGRLGLTDDRGGPRCAAVRPPVIDWAAADPG
jgi:hypothetical protein